MISISFPFPFHSIFPFPFKHSLFFNDYFGISLQEILIRTRDLVRLRRSSFFSSSSFNFFEFSSFSLLFVILFNISSSSSIKKRSYPIFSSYRSGLKFPMDLERFRDPNSLPVVPREGRQTIFSPIPGWRDE